MMAEVKGQEGLLPPLSEKDRLARAFQQGGGFLDIQEVGFRLLAVEHEIAVPPDRDQPGLSGVAHL